MADLIKCRGRSKVYIHLLGSSSCQLRKITFPLDKSLLHLLVLICLDRIHLATGNSTEKQLDLAETRWVGLSSFLPNLALPGDGNASHVNVLWGLQRYFLCSRKDFSTWSFKAVQSQGSLLFASIYMNDVNFVGVVCTKWSLLTRQLHLILVSGYYISRTVSLSTYRKGFSVSDRSGQRNSNRAQSLFQQRSSVHIQYKQLKVLKPKGPLVTWKNSWIGFSSASEGENTQTR